MTFALADIDFLASEAGDSLLDELAAEDLSDAHTLRLITDLRKRYTAQQAAAALSMARVRLKAADKFGMDAARMFFTEESAQQASHPLVSAYRAARIPTGRIDDVCCGTGADALSLARHDSRNRLYGIDHDPVRIAIAAYNANAIGLENVAFAVADAHEFRPQAAGTVFYDPARRDEQGRRIHDVERYIPPLSLIQGWDVPRVVVKLSPGVDIAQLTPYRGELEFISVSGDLKEAVLWRNADADDLRTTATLLIGDTVHRWLPDADDAPPVTAEPSGWLVEPDPALIRAGLVVPAARAFDGHLLDETIAYFTTESRPDSPWVRGWEILDWMPFNLKKLRAHLRERNIGTVTVKKRGSPLTPEALNAQLKLKGDESRTLVLTRYAGKPIVMICADYTL